MEPEVTKPADGMTDYGLIELSGSENTRDQGGIETVTGQRVRAKSSFVPTSSRSSPIMISMCSSMNTSYVR